jgi:hypothetical protein
VANIRASSEDFRCPAIDAIVFFAMVEIAKERAGGDGVAGDDARLCRPQETVARERRRSVGDDGRVIGDDVCLRRSQKTTQGKQCGGCKAPSRDLLTRARLLSEGSACRRPSAESRRCGGDLVSVGEALLASPSRPWTASRGICLQTPEVRRVCLCRDCPLFFEGTSSRPERDLLADARAGRE